MTIEIPKEPKKKLWGMLVFIVFIPENYNTHKFMDKNKQIIYKNWESHISIQGIFFC